MPFAFAVVAATGWAVSDVLAASAGRKMGSITLAFYMQVFGFILTLPLAIAVGGSPTARDLTIGVAAGCVNATAYILLVEGLRRGSVGTVIPASAATNAILPVAAGLLLGDRLSLAGQLGIAAAVAGATMSSLEKLPGSDVRRLTPNKTALLFGITSGVGFGVMYILMSRTGTDSGVWPVLCMRAAIPLVYGFARVKHASLRISTTVMKNAAAVSITGAGALVAYTYASREGQLSVIAAIVSTSPALAVALVHLLGRERVSTVQALGVVIAVAGIAALCLS